MTKKPLKVLLIDDDSDIVELLSYNLAKEGYDVIGITNPQEATEAIRNFSPQLVVMDIIMPGQSGLELCSTLRNIEGGDDLTIFFITAGEENLNQAALASGGDDFIQKFSGLRTLINRINLVMKKNLVIRKRINTLRVGPLEIHRSNLTANNPKGEVALSSPEFDLLFFLAQNATRSIPIKSLASIVNSADSRYGDSILKLLRTLAKKIGEGITVYRGEHRVTLNV
jgi:two-component system, OmpR family, alkaline phosphatase synthesis response regulator PhoP